MSYHMRRRIHACHIKGSRSTEHPRAETGASENTVLRILSESYVFGLWSGDSHGNVIIRKAQRRIHADERRPGRRSVIRVPPARAYNAGRAGLVDLELCTRTW